MAAVNKTIGTSLGSVGAGTVAATNGSVAVVGTGTTFTSYSIGQYIAIDDGGGYVTYTIAAITDNTNLDLGVNFTGSTGSGYAYKPGARDYSTITLWEAADGGGDGAGNDACTGSCYDDSAFDEVVTINFVALSVTLTVAAGERHDGTAGTGVRLVAAGNGSSSITLLDPAPNKTCSWIEIDANGKDYSFTFHMRGISGKSAGMSRCISHGTRYHGRGIQIDGYNTVASGYAVNCISYDNHLDNASGSNGSGFQCGYIGYLCNCTAHDIQTDYGAVNGYVPYNVSAGANIKNCIATSIGGDCFTGSTLDRDYNLSSDATADGANSLPNKTAADQFVSTVGGSEDLHLKSGADAINAGTDLGTTPTGVNFDIDNRDRDAEGDTWDMGADEFVGVGAPTARNLLLLGVGT